YGSTLKAVHETGKIDPDEIYPYITEGIGEDIVPKNYDFSLIDHFEKVSDKEAALMAREITRKEGIFVGYSCGSVVQGLIQMKDKLSKDDLVVLIFPDHGSRYVAKIYNDEWMRDRGWLEVKTIRDIIESRINKTLISIEADKTVAEAVAVLTANDIDQMPVMEDGKMVGSINESGLLLKLLRDHNVKAASVKEVMDATFPIVANDVAIDKLSSMMSKEVNAVMTLDALNQLSIVTKSDIIRAMAK
ncbi:MAG: pyridoxal-phosphate dependent enzyme, partial [Chitinophagales bacterium]